MLSMMAPAENLPGVARRAAPIRHVLLVWPRPGRSWTAGHHEPAEEHQDRLRGLFRPHPDAGTAAGPLGAAVRLDHGREDQGPDCWRISIEGCRPAPSRHGNPQDYRQAAARPITGSVAVSVGACRTRPIDARLDDHK